MTAPTSTSASNSDDSLENLQLRDDAANSRLVLAPSRGGMATLLTLRGRDLFFLDEATLRDFSKNVRGGNPVLFPSPGKLEGDAYERDGVHGSLKQHGFARHSKWDVIDAAATSATLRLVSNEETRRDYPWDFIAEYKYSLNAGALRVDMTFTNTGDSPMPFGAGFHPYFHVPQASKANAHIETNATRAFDNVTKKTEALVPIDLTKAEVDLHLIDHHGDCMLRLPDYAVRVRGSKEFSRFVVWTLAGKDFVCVEPWTCPGNALNTGESLIVLAPRQTHELWAEYALV